MDVLYRRHPGGVVGVVVLRLERLQGELGLLEPERRLEASGNE